MASTKPAANVPSHVIYNDRVSDRRLLARCSICSNSTAAGKLPLEICYVSVCNPAVKGSIRADRLLSLVPAQESVASAVKTTPPVRLCPEVNVTLDDCPSQLAAVRCLWDWEGWLHSLHDAACRRHWPGPVDDAPTVYIHCIQGRDGAAPA